MNDNNNDLLDLVNQIKSSSQGGGGIAFLLSQLPEETARCFQLCAIPHYFNHDMLLAIAPFLDFEKAKSLCDEFAGFSVVTPSEQGWVIHDKTREYLFRQWLSETATKASLFTETSARLAEFFLQSASSEAVPQLRFEQQAQQAFHLFGANQKTGLKLFDKLFRQSRHTYQLSQCETLLSLLHEYDAVLQQEHRLLLTYHEGKLALDQRRWPAAETLLQEVTASPHLQPELQIKAMMRLGIAQAGERKWDTAQHSLESALSLIDNSPDLEKHRHKVLHELAVVLRDKSNANSDQAIEMLRNAIDLAHLFEDFPSMATNLNTLGTLYLKHRQITQATRVFQAALEALDKSKEYFRKAAVYNNLGLVEMEQRNWQDSRNYFEEALKIETDAGRLLGQAYCLNNLSRAYQNLDEMDKAVDAATRASQLFIRMADPGDAAISRRNLGRIYRKMGKHEDARAAFNRAITWFNKAKNDKQANNTAEELKNLDKKQGTPWWAWLSIIVFILLILIGISVSE